MFNSGFFRTFVSMLQQTEAIVLHSFKYGETRLIVDVFTRRAGRLSLIATMPRSQKGRLKKQYFQPMTLLEVAFDQRPQVQLQALKDARLLTAWSSIPFSPEKLALSLFCAEFLYHALRSEQQNEPLFSYICDAFLWLDMAEQSFANFHLTFLMRLSRFLGFYPNLEVSGPQAEPTVGQKSVWDAHTEEPFSLMFDLREGRFCAEAPLHRDFLPPQEARLIRLLMRMDFPTMHLFKFSRHDRNRIVEVLLAYYQLHIPQFPELKSFQVLRELWAE